VGFGNFIDVECESCGGTGFIPEAMEVTLEGKNIKDILSMTVEEAAEFFKGKDKNIEGMLSILLRVGMEYITLGQKTPTISGGESQRIKLAKELSKGKNARDTVYILDEPTTGLSFQDSIRLMKLMQELVDKNNTVIITKHDPYMLSNCDYIIEMGVGGGSDGGNIIAVGTPAELKRNKNSIIGRYLK
jgi:excinuclease UvrABC ATPase subunit